MVVDAIGAKSSSERRVLVLVVGVAFGGRSSLASGSGALSLEYCKEWDAINVEDEKRGQEQTFLCC